MPHHLNPIFFLSPLTAESMRVAPGVKLYGSNRKAKITKPAVKANKPTLRKSLKPGTVVILLTGRFAGKHAVFLRQLPSGLILVSGPFRSNGVPLKRVQQTHVIPTQTRVRLPKNLAKSVKDCWFYKAKSLPRLEAKKLKEAEEKKEKKTPVLNVKKTKRSKLTPLYANTQKRIDKEIVKAIKRVPHLNAYMQSRFKLKSTDRPHDMVF